MTVPAAVAETAVHRARWADLDPRTAYRLLRLRMDVFVVEQACAYPDIDGRDLEEDAEHVWTADDAGPTAYLRVLAEPGGVVRIGRICTRADARGRGLAGRLVADVLARHPGRPSVLDAQAQLTGWYGRLGYRVAGPAYLEDGIPHVPMRRDP